MRGRTQRHRGPSRFADLSTTKHARQRPNTLNTGYTNLVPDEIRPRREPHRDRHIIVVALHYTPTISTRTRNIPEPNQTD